jgi:uncharacterized membrane protein
MNETNEQSGGFDANHPTIVALLYLSSVLLGFTGIIGVVLAYIWRGENYTGWEASHYTYHIRTFWFGLLGYFIGFILTFVLIGIFVMIAVTIWMVVRSVVAMLKAQKKEPIPDPSTFWI